MSLSILKLYSKLSKSIVSVDFLLLSCECSSYEAEPIDSEFWLDEELLDLDDIDF